MRIISESAEDLSVTNFVNGRWIEGTAGSLDIISPYTGLKCGTTTLSNSDDVDQAVNAATKAIQAWKETSLKSRTQILFKFREILLREQDKIVDIICLESGKIPNEARAELLKGLEVLEYALSLQNSDSGGKMEVSHGVYCEDKREALGVVASITPFNFPVMVPMWTIPIAITLGNAYIWKPSEKTPLASKFIAEAFHEAGLPAGIFTVINGNEEAAAAIINHQNVQAIAFVGSTKIAKRVYAHATSLGKRALCLGGAKNHIILLPDADIQISGPGISDSFTGCAGQRCMAASVLLAVGNVDEHIADIIVHSESHTLGESMGAIITRQQVDFLNEAIAEALDSGAKLLLDGRNPVIKDSYKNGFWLGPTILDNVQPGSKAACLELFGPILSIIRCENVTEAISIQNSSAYGNAASVFTRSGQLAEHLANRAKCGMFGVNIGVPVPREPFSFGGVNASKFGHGDITGESSLDFWSNTKKITTKWELQTDQSWMS